jgi:tetratricopeptide (TPR) repeat protein
MTTKALLFDKAQIIALMKQAFRRLRKLNVHVGDVIQTLNERHPDMTRARFDDMFMTRPERDCTATLPLIADVIQVMYGYDAQLWSATDLLQLLIALRVPINQISLYSVYFWGDEWPRALQKYGMGTPLLGASGGIVGREEIVQQLRQDMLQRRTIVLSGEAGVGKTALALELARMYEIHHHQRVYYLDVNQTASLSSFYMQLADAFQIKQMGNEPLLLRLKMVLATRQIYVVLDGLDGEAPLAAEVLLSQLVHHFPTMRCIVTTRLVGLAEYVPAGVQYAVSSLASDRIYDPAPLLFLRVFRQAGGRYMPEQQILDICQQVRGNPLMLSMMANAVAGMSLESMPASPIAEMLHTLTAVESQIVTLIVFSQRPIPRAFVELFLEPMHQTLVSTPVAATLADLARRGVIIAVEPDELYGVHVLIRQMWQRRLDAAQQLQCLHDIAQALLAVRREWEDDPSHIVPHLTSEVMNTVSQMVLLLLEHGQHQVAVQVLVHWHTLWIRHGFTLEAVEICERCLVFMPETDVLTMELNYALGALYANRGAINMAHTYITRAYEQSHALGLPFWQAKISVERGLVGLYAVRASEDDLFHVFRQGIESAIQYFSDYGDVLWQARSYDMLAYMHFSVGQLRQALACNDIALQLFRDHGKSIGLWDAMWNRGLILMAVGDFPSARSYLQQARQIYQTIRLPINTAHCNLRLAAIAALDGDAPQTFEALAQAFEILHRVGGMQDLLYLMDIYCGYLMRVQRVHDTLLLAELSSRFREERQISRGAMLNHIMEQQLVQARQLAPLMPVNEPLFHAEMNFYEVLTVMRSQLLHAVK